MRTCLTISLLIWSVLALSGTLSAAEKTRQITGNVTSVDMNRGTITVIKKDRMVVLAVEEKTDIVQCTGGMSIGDIKTGDRVTAKYKESPDKSIAKSLTLRAEGKED